MMLFAFSPAIRYAASQQTFSTQHRMPIKIIKKHPFKIVSVLLALGLGYGVATTPWTQKIEEQAHVFLAQNGFADAAFKITKLGLDSAIVEDISLGAAVPLEIGKLTLDYTAHDLKNFPFKLNAENLFYKVPNVNLTAAHASVNGTGNITDKSGTATWAIDGIHVTAGELDIPVLNGAGNITLDKNTITMDGELRNTDKSYRASFVLNYPMLAPTTAQLHLITATFPWNKGKISTKNVLIPLNGKAAIKMNMVVQKIPVDTLMQMLTGVATPATGVVSGTLPVTLKPDGNIMIGEGKLQTESPGTIALSPETIPGDNEQIALVRDIMKNLHYKVLSIGMNNDKKGKLSVLLALEGNNPDVANGREVKLNVQLTGDVLNLIQQSLLSLIDPNMFLKQAPHKN
jgi:Dicarboxylate transport